MWLLDYTSRLWLSSKLNNFGRCIGAMFGLGVASWLGFQYVLVPNGGCHVTGLSLVYTRAITIMLLGCWIIPMVIPYVKSKIKRFMQKWKQGIASWFVQILVLWIKPTLYLVYFVRIDGERSYTIRFSICEQVGFTIFVLLFSLLFLFSLGQFQQRRLPM
jgi:succinate dehydrogenase hydrophobic anchor subunit